MIFLIGKRNKKVAIVVSIVATVITVFIGLGIIYVNDYYRAEMDAIVEFNAGTEVLKKVLKDNTIVYEGSAAEIGLIFYPGGKVEYTAYEPLMKSLASEGIMCVLVEMPFHLAVLDVNAAEGIQEMYPDIKNWYIGGHSLGGSMAAAYLKENADYYDGLILLGAYSTADLSETDLEVLSIYGSEDKVLNNEKYLEYKTNLPGDFSEVVIDGGCHAYFGMYGQQEGDGSPTLSNEEQIRITTDEIIKMIGEKHVSGITEEK